MKHVSIVKKGLSTIIDQTSDNFPSKVYITTNSNSPVFTGKNSCYIYIHEIDKGSSIDFLKGDSFPLKKGSIIRTPVGRSFRLRKVKHGMVVEMIGVNEVFQINPNLEDSGRLKYIDGCTDTLILSPTIIGLPCLNTLYFPKDTIQTLHTHPSYRIGMVINGEGLCETPEGLSKIEEGDLIIVHTDGVHGFRTKQQKMALISFHPDSEFGPADTNHPMINRTIVGGISASHLKEIQTKN